MKDVMSGITPDQIADVEFIISNMQCENKPTVDEFLTFIAQTVEASLIGQEAVLV